MTPATILLINLIIESILRVVGEIRDDPTTPEEARLRAELAFTRLTAARDAVASVTPAAPPA